MVAGMQRVLMVADPGPDVDDVKSILLACHLHKRRLLEFLGVVCNGGRQAKNRALLASAVIHNAYPELADEVIVAVGRTRGNEKPHSPASFEYSIEGYGKHEAKLWKAEDLFEKVLDDYKQRDPFSLTVQVQAGFTDFADALDRWGSERFRNQLHSVVAMGGVKHEEGVWEPDDAYNNQMDPEAAARVYRFCQAQRVPLTVVGRDAVETLPLQFIRDVAREVGADPDEPSTGTPMMQYLLRAQDESLMVLWKRVCMGTELPPRCTKEWYFKTFCGVSDYVTYCAENFGSSGQSGGFNPPPDKLNIRDHLKGFVKPYDPLTLLACLGRRAPALDWDREDTRVRVEEAATRCGWAGGSGGGGNREEDEEHLGSSTPTLHHAASPDSVGGGELPRYHHLFQKPGVFDTKRDDHGMAYFRRLLRDAILGTVEPRESDVDGAGEEAGKRKRVGSA